MHTLRRRIEALERANSADLDRQRDIANQALRRLSWDDLEALHAAYTAEELGQPVTDRQAAVRRAYVGALNRGCRSAGIRPITGNGLAFADPDLRVGLLMACRLSLEEIQLTGSALRAVSEGRQLTDQESVAVKTCELRMGIDWSSHLPPRKEQAS
jgi:hypothetical protein